MRQLHSPAWDTRYLLASYRRTEHAPPSSFGISDFWFPLRPLWLVGRVAWPRSSSKLSAQSPKRRAKSAFMFPFIAYRLSRFAMELFGGPRWAVRWCEPMADGPMSNGPGWGLGCGYYGLWGWRVVRARRARADGQWPRNKKPKPEGANPISQKPEANLAKPTSTTWRALDRVHWEIRWMSLMAYGLGETDTLPPSLNLPSGQNAPCPAGEGAFTPEFLNSKAGEILSTSPQQTPSFFVTYIVHAVGYRPHTALTCLYRNLFMHPHRMDDRGTC
jgi:hypothetical protein